MCDDVQATEDNQWYPTVESLPKYTDPVESNGYWGAIKLAAYGAVYSQHMRCGRYVQFNHACEWCYDEERFPFFNLVNFIQNNTPRERDTPSVKEFFERNIDKKIAEFCHD
jgi:hypothetical protein